MNTRPLRLTAAVVAMAMAGGAHALRAQAKTVTIPISPAIIKTTNTVTIDGTFAVVPGSLVQNSKQANPCNPGACYDAAPTVRANRGWQLEVTLSQTPPDFIVAWIQTPSNSAHPLAAGTYQVIATGAGSTPGQVLSIMYNANRITGKDGIVPTAAQLAAVLSYRVVASP